MLPNLIVIGAMKCATTSFHYYLSLHPEIAVSRNKELHFFVEELAWSRGVDWYSAQFPDEKVRGETSPTYSMYPKFLGVPERMAGLIPDARLIYLVRDPVERTISHYFHDRVEGIEKRPIVEAFACLGGNSYLGPSLYHFQLRQYLRYFPRDQILLITCDDLLHNRAASLRRVFSFLGVDEAFWSPRFALMRHRTTLRRQRTALGAVVSNSSAVTLLNRLPWRIRGYVEWLLFYPLSRRVTLPNLPSDIRRALSRALRADTEALVAEWDVGHDWIARLVRES